MRGQLDAGDEGGVQEEEHNEKNILAGNTNNNENGKNDVEVMATSGGDSKCCPDCDAAHPATGSIRSGLFLTEGVQGFWESVVAMLTLGVVCGWFYIISVFWGALVAHALIFRSLVTGTIAAVVLSSCWWPLDNRYPRERFINSWIFRVWKRYFQWQCFVEEALDPSKRYMFAEMPHGIVPLGAMLSISVVRETFPGMQYISGVAANIVLRLPGIRLLYAWMGVRKAGRKSILEMFEDGVQVAVVVGGIAEMFLVSRTEERLYLRKRKTFVRIAVEAGASIVPVYFFGNSLLFDLVGGGDNNSWLCVFSRKVKSSLLLFYGRFFTTIPHRQQLKMVVGRPIPVVQSDTPDDAYVNSLHEELIRRVEVIYRDHRPDWEKRELVIL